MPRFNDLSGSCFGKLQVLHKESESSGKRVKFVCRCECGNIKPVLSSLLTRGKAISCGCYRKTHLVKHGHSRRGANSPEYKAWNDIKSRCLNSNDMRYAYYGGRGITLCDEWQNSFIPFLEHIGLRPNNSYSIDRINVNGNYEPGNVRWATKSEQMLNRRTVNATQLQLVECKDRIAKLEGYLVSIGVNPNGI